MYVRDVCVCVCITNNKQLLHMDFNRIYICNLHSYAMFQTKFTSFILPVRAQVYACIYNFSTGVHV